MKMSFTLLKKSCAAFVFVLFVFYAGSSHAVEGLHGFAEGGWGLKFGDERAEKDDFNLAEARVQLKYLHFPGFLEGLSGEVFLKGELLADGYDESVTADARELNLFLRPLDTLDIKAGRQVLTWGTGDYIFINDLFPKDYVSFFIGRDDEYLKLPSDAVRVWLFTDTVNLDFVLIPFFEPDNSLRGDRLSFYDGLTGEISGESMDRVFTEPAGSTENMELALRAYGNVKGVEAALYLFNGFYKEPRGIKDASREEFFYPRLQVYGFSVRGPVLGGVGNIEAGYYSSRDDLDGTDGAIENPSIKYLAGYSRDLRDDLRAGVQYLVEETLYYDRYRESLSEGTPAADEFRHLLTLRLTKLLRAQTVEASLFTFYSPSDRDVYLRPSVGYKVTDNLKVTAGANIFSGRFDHTEFGQLEGNNNVYARVRYSF